MRIAHVASLALLLTLVLRTDATAESWRSDLRVSRGAPGEILFSTGTITRAKAVAGVDTFCLYGGPGSTRGKFQTLGGVVPLTLTDLLAEPSTIASEPDGWGLVDVTDQPTFWQRSTYNMANLNSNGVGNSGMWAGRTSAQEAGWSAAPGYGNSWNALLEWRTAAIDPAVGQSVSLSFAYNHDSEPSFDFFEVEYDSAGSAIVVSSVSGTNKTGPGAFPAPGVAFSTSLPFDANGYGNGNAEIVIRLAARTDGAYSDEDGIFDSEGLVQVDDITVSWTGNAGPQSDTETFEGGGPYSWTPVMPPFAGFFGKVFPVVQDLDPCISNLTPMFLFIDDGTPPSNPTYTGPGTGGTTSVNWSYGVPGGWVVNYNGGVSSGTLGLDNQLVTPATAWDLPSTADDGGDVAGAFFRMDVWRHLPLSNGFLYTWAVRTRDSVSSTWTPWNDRNFVYYGGGPNWLSQQVDVSDLISTTNGPDGIQLRVECLDLARAFAFAGTDATISPAFDNLSLFKYRIGGPVISARAIDLFQDSFTQSGNTAVSTQADRDAMDVRIDMAQDISTGANIVPGDSLVVTVTPVIPGSTVDSNDIKMVWQLRTHPGFEDAIRGNLTSYPGAVYIGGNWNGVTTAQYTGVGDRYFFDLPDSDFMYPGDVLHYYIEATDDAMRTTTLPADTTGWRIPEWDNKVGEDCVTFTFITPYKTEPYRMEGKPSIWLQFTEGPEEGKSEPVVTTYDQPPILVIEDSGVERSLNGWYHAARQLGLRDYVEYDVYRVLGPSSGVSNGIGSSGAHGATGPQLADYDCVIYLAEEQEAFLLSDGTNIGLNDKGDDLGTLTAWHNQAAQRFAVYFADNIGTSLVGSSAGQTYLSTIMNVIYNDNDVKDEIGGTVAPIVQPTVDGLTAGFLTDFVAYGGCPQINRFDSIAAGGGAIKSHDFNLGLFAPAAGVVYDRTESGNRKVNVTFPYGYTSIFDGGSTGAGGGLSDRTVLLQELIDLNGGHGTPGPPTDTPPDPEELRIHRMVPNPFNPQTTLRLEVPHRAHVSVRVYNLRGELVRVLVDAPLEAGRQDIVWTGVDGRGTRVASGVYLVRVEGLGKSETQKVMLLK